MSPKPASLIAVAASVALSGCSAQYPFDGVQFCLASMDEADELYAILSSVAQKHELSIVDDSAGISNDLELLESPLARQPIIYILIKDEGWFSGSGPIMVNNVGSSSAREVRVSFFRSTSWLGSDEKTDEIAQDVAVALSKSWPLSDYPGFKLVGEASLC